MHLTCQLKKLNWSILARQLASLRKDIGKILGVILSYRAERSGVEDVDAVQVDREDSACPFTGAGACWKSDVSKP